MSIAAPSLDTLVRSLADRASVVRLLAELGIAPAPSDIPPAAWSAYGLAGIKDLEAVVLAGAAGALDALVLELAAGAAADRFAACARACRSRNPARLHLFVGVWPRCARLALGVFDLEGRFRHLVLEPACVRASDLEALEEMRPADGETGLRLALRYAHALDRSRVTRRFYRDFSARRASVARAWAGLPEDAERERLQLALLFLCRLTFLYFLQRRGALAGDERYLVRLFGAWAAEHGRETGGGFYRQRLVPLFFEALNRPADRRSAAAEALGPLPYLNGGLFEPHALERRFPGLAVPDQEVRGVLEDLLERYRFSPAEAARDPAAGIDPEILGRVFEGLMAPDTRDGTGSFYTPAPVVDRVVREALVEYAAVEVGRDAAARVVDGAAVPVSVGRAVAGRLERVRVLDPACGSGAFLLGALARLTHALTQVTGRPSGAVRREILGHTLHGVDLLDDAALLCSLRLWLALSADDGEIRPLPNLDRRIRQGDALVDPLDLGALAADEAGASPFHPLRDPAVRRGLRAVESAGGRYLRSRPDERAERRQELARAEAALARSWVTAARAAQTRRGRELRARALDRDLFGDQSPAARRADLELGALQERSREIESVALALEEDDALPFFSFGIHFAAGDRGFDVILSNPPWVRAHRWPHRLRRLAARRFEVCRGGGWKAGAELAGAPAGVGAQIDLALLFLERSLRLLAPGGVLAVLLPAKSFRALYGGAARRIALRDLEFRLIEDHALDQRSIFRADAFAGILIGRRRDGPRAVETRVRMVRRGVPPLEFVTDPASLPLFPDDRESPWLLAPPEVVAALRRMQAAGPPLGRHEGRRVRRGVMTGANEVLVLRQVRPGLGGLARVEADGYARSRRAGRSASTAARYRAVLETSAVRPLVRGADIDAFGYRTGSYVVWCHGRDGAPVEPPPRTARYLSRHRKVLEGRQGWRSGLPLGAVFRLSPETLGPKVAWQDLSDTLRAVALPSAVPLDGRDVELVPLNTLYFLPVADRREALLVAGLLNSLPVRTFARVLAERAKDARFRFFAWTMSCLPLPVGLEAHPAAAVVAGVSERAHAAGGIGAEDQSRLDGAVAALYGLGEDAMEALAGFDRWLRGDP